MGDPGVGGQAGQFDLPEPVAVLFEPPASAQISSHQGLRVGPGSLVLPPAAQGGHGESGGVVVDADRDPSQFSAEIEDPIRDRLAHLRVDEVMGLDPLRIVARCPGPAIVLVGTDEFLFWVSTETTGSRRRAWRRICSFR